MLKAVDPAVATISGRYFNAVEQAAGSALDRHIDAALFAELDELRQLSAQLPEAMAVVTAREIRQVTLSKFSSCP